MESVHMAESETVCAAPGLNTLEPECVSAHGGASDVHHTHSPLIKTETDLGSPHTGDLIKTEGLDSAELQCMSSLHSDQIKTEPDGGEYFKEEDIIKEEDTLSVNIKSDHIKYESCSYLLSDVMNTVSIGAAVGVLDQTESGQCAGEPNQNCRNDVSEKRHGCTWREKKKAARERRKAGPSAGDLIVKAVSASKKKSGVSLAALKKALAAGGYDVEKNNSRVKVALRFLVTKGTLFRVKGTGAAGSFIFNKKQPAEKKPAKKAAPKAKKPYRPTSAQSGRAKVRKGASDVNRVYAQGADPDLGSVRICNSAQRGARFPVKSGPSAHVPDHRTTEKDAAHFFGMMVAENMRALPPNLQLEYQTDIVQLTRRYQQQQ